MGRRYDLICEACAKRPNDAEAHLRRVCRQCFRDLDAEGYWDGIVGRPQVLERGTDLAIEVEAVELPGLRPDAVLDIQPVESSPRPVWLALTAAGDLVRLDLAGRSASTVAHLPESGLRLDQPARPTRRAALRELSSVLSDAPVSLHVAPAADMVAVVNTHGQHGVVIDLATGAATMRLERGAYCVEFRAFSVAFFVLDGELRLVHATDWNRLDVSDPKTGRLLTDRSPTSYRRGEPRPGHYLDYFHCGLAVSPGREWIADNGWVWNPVGLVTTWSLRRWLRENVWESEDGPSQRMLCWRHYFWDGPLCWVDDHTLAVWGYGRDDDWLIPAVRLFDVRSGKEIRWFAGPAGRLVFDGHLFAFSAEQGTSAWDVDTGERLLHEPGFAPTRYHRGAKRFLARSADGSWRLGRLVQRRSP